MKKDLEYWKRSTWNGLESKPLTWIGRNFAEHIDNLLEWKKFVVGYQELTNKQRHDKIQEVMKLIVGLNDAKDPEEFIYFEILAKEKVEKIAKDCLYYHDKKWTNITPSWKGIIATSPKDFINDAAIMNTEIRASLGDYIPKEEQYIADELIGKHKWQILY